MARRSGQLYEKTVEELFRDYADQIITPVSKDEIIRYFNQKYPKIKTTTVTAHIYWLTVNNISRASARKIDSDGTDDILFKTEDGRYKQYNKQTDGEPIHTVMGAKSINKKEIKMTSVKTNETKTISTKNYLPLTNDAIDKEDKLVIESVEYGKESELIHTCLAAYPKNDDIKIIAMKIALIDVTNSTQLFKQKAKVNLYDLADLISKIPNFDKRLSEGDPELVALIAKNTGKVNLFSFATKYCTYHNVEVYNRDDYSIFDGIVEDMLPHYCFGLTKGKIENWKNADDYVAFNNCIGKVLDDNGINIKSRRRKFDHFLWYQNKHQ